MPDQRDQCEGPSHVSDSDNIVSSDDTWSCDGSQHDVMSSDGSQHDVMSSDGSQANLDDTLPYNDPADTCDSCRTIRQFCPDMFFEDFVSVVNNGTLSTETPVFQLFVDHLRLLNCEIPGKFVYGDQMHKALT